ncbi:hypothetical protein Tco_1545885 [Tanacetum coccineum]
MRLSFLVACHYVDSFFNGISWIQEDVEIQGRTSVDTEIVLDQEEPTELVEDLGSGEKGEKETSTDNVPVSTASAIPEVSTAGPSSSTADVFEDEMMTIAESLVAIRRTRTRTTSVVIHDPEEEPRRTVPEPTSQSHSSYKDKGKEKMIEPDEPVKIKRRDQKRVVQEEASQTAITKELDEIQAMIEADEQVAARLQSEEQEKYIIKEKVRMLAEMITERKKFFAAQRAAKIKSRPPTKAQVSSFVPKDSDDKEKGSRKKILAKKRAGEKQSEESTKRQKKEDDTEKEELRASMDVALRDDVAIDVESLATKYPIVDWKTHVLTENMLYYQIIRGDGSLKNYKIFSDMLDDFDRQDVMDLYRLVQERYDTTSPKGYDLLLWGDLKILFESNVEDKIWKIQQDYNLISWRLFDSYGIHILLMNTGVAIHMMIEKKYPLTREMLSRMLSRRLEVDHEIWKNHHSQELIEWKLYDSCGVHSLMLGEVSIHMLVEKKYPLPQDTLMRMLQWKLHVNYNVTEMAYELLRFIRSQLNQ